MSESELSEREIEILKLVALGLSNKEIAYRLRISPNTVKVHLKNIFGKIGVVSRTEAAMFAVRQGWIEAGSPSAVGTAESEEKGSVLASVPAPSPLPLGLLGVGGFAAVVGLVVLLVSLASSSNPRVIEIVVTPTPEPVRWELVTRMPEPKKSMAYAAVDNKIYIIGGETPNGISDRVDIYDTVTEQWSEGARKPTPVSEACGAYLGGKIIVAGGKKADGSVTNVVEAYDVVEDRWERLPELPFPLAGAGCVEHEGHVYLFGGLDMGKTRSEIILYSISDKVVRIVGELSVPRAYFTVSKLGNQVFLVGGWDGKDALDSITKWSLGTVEPAIEFGSLNEGRYRLASQSVLDRVYLIGGTNDSLAILNSFEFDPKNGRRRLIANPENRPWYGHGAVSLGEHLYGFGGAIGERIAGELYRLRVLYTILLPIVQ